ncbi:hypothetical protein H2199_007468 [Coniosporium tulheliwenetii]|uniref:Uncharacterized protein n=1 Tax=Coniosporium tulheliwenetii TaxID=3383036 RepID=A0ACC2YP95_9PEZI|nr:hypothetical protein H2199_007468 [Cladosporium sp. JES 115]
MALSTSTHQSQGDEKPPSYDTAAEENRGEVILKIIKNTLATEARSPFGEPSPKEVQRLRNFLLYALLVDYQVGLSRKVTLSQEDVNHFFQLWDSEVLIRALNKWQGDYFESLGFKTFVELRPGEGLDGWCNANFESYTLNKEGQEYQQQQQKGMKRAQQEQEPSIKHESLLQKAKTYLEGLKQRAAHERLNQSMGRSRITPAPPAPQFVDTDDRLSPGSVANPDFWRDKSNVKHTGSNPDTERKG